MNQKIFSKDNYNYFEFQKIQTKDSDDEKYSILILHSAIEAIYMKKLLNSEDFQNIVHPIETVCFEIQYLNDS